MSVHWAREEGGRSIKALLGPRSSGFRGTQPVGGQWHAQAQGLLKVLKGCPYATRDKRRPSDVEESEEPVLRGSRFN